ITVLDESGKERITMKCPKSGPEIRLTDTTGKHTLTVTITENRESIAFPAPQIDMTDQAGDDLSHLAISSGASGTLIHTSHTNSAFSRRGGSMNMNVDGTGFGVRDAQEYSFTLGGPRPAGGHGPQIENP